MDQKPYRKFYTSSIKTTWFTPRIILIGNTCLLLIVCIVYYLTMANDISRNQNLFLHLVTNKTDENKNDHRDELKEVLDGASMATKTVIIAIVNKAYVEGDRPMLDLFLDGFWMGDGTRGLIDHLLIVAMDQSSYQRCRSLRLHCYKLETDGVDFVGEKVYMSEDFIKMMWRRTLFLGEVLNHGYGFIFTDMDVLWLRNPFPYLTTEPPPDLQISTDRFRGNPWSEKHRINTGFYMIRSNRRTQALFRAWFAHSHNSTGLKEQDVLQDLMHQGLFNKLGLQVKLLDTRRFSGFCQDSRDPAAVATVHANCCVGISAKLADLTAVVREWERSRSSSASESETAPFRWPYHGACKNSLRQLRVLRKL